MALLSVELLLLTDSPYFDKHIYSCCCHANTVVKSKCKSLKLSKAYQNTLGDGG